MKDISPFFINPFQELSDRGMFRISLIGYLVASLQVYLFNYVPDGVFQLHVTESTAWYAGLVNNAINIIVPTAVLFMLARSLYVKTRWLDVLLVVMLSQLVISVIALLLTNPMMQVKSFGIARAVDEGDKALETVPNFDLFLTIVAAFMGLALLVYFFYLMVIGMKIAMNSKRKVHGVWVVLVILLTDALLHFWPPYV